LFSKAKVPEHLLIPFSKISSNCEEILRTWFLKRKLLEGCVNSYVSAFKNPNSYNPDKLLLLARALESFHRDLRTSAKVAQYSRYYQLYTEVQRGFNLYLKIPSKTKFCRKLTNLRNEFTHNLNNPYNKFYRSRDLYKISEQIKIILASLFLKELGFDIKEIHIIISQYGFWEI
jgi:hypothetical protein